MDLKETLDINPLVNTKNQWIWDNNMKFRVRCEVETDGDVDVDGFFKSIRAKVKQSGINCKFRRNDDDEEFTFILEASFANYDDMMKGYGIMNSFEDVNQNEDGDEDGDDISEDRITSFACFLTVIISTTDIDTPMLKYVATPELDIETNKSNNRLDQLVSMIIKYQRDVRKGGNLKQVMWNCQQEMVDKGFEAAAKW
jgi:hypothetical protein